MQSPSASEDFPDGSALQHNRGQKSRVEYESTAKYSEWQLSPTTEHFFLSQSIWVQSGQRVQTFCCRETPDNLIQGKSDKQTQGQVRSPKVWKKFISLTNVTETRPLSCSRWSDVNTSHRCSKFHHHRFITSETRGHAGNVATGLHQHITQELRAPLCDDCTCNCKVSFCRGAPVLSAGIQ